MSNEIYKVEIISNQSIQDDIIELLEQEISDIQYTILPECHGSGAESKKLGDMTWPEMNFILFSYVDYEKAKKIKKIMEAIKQKFPKEGISWFFSKSEILE